MFSRPRSYAMDASVANFVRPRRSLCGGPRTPHPAPRDENLHHRRQRAYLLRCTREEVIHIMARDNDMQDDMDEGAGTGGGGLEDDTMGDEGSTSGGGERGGGSSR